MSARKKVGWGGRRVRAGRKPGPNPKVRHKSRPALASRFPCHVSIEVGPHVPSLRQKRFLQRFEASLARGERDDFRFVHYWIVEKRVDFIVEAQDSAALGRGMKSLSRRVSQNAGLAFDIRGPILKDRYKLRILKTPLDVRQALASVPARGAGKPGATPRTSLLLGVDFEERG